MMPVAVVGGGVVGGVGGEMDSTGGERLPGAVPRCLKGEYSPQSMASADTEKKSSKRKRDIAGESVISQDGISWAAGKYHDWKDVGKDTTSVGLHRRQIRVKCCAETEIQSRFPDLTHLFVQTPFRHEYTREM